MWSLFIYLNVGGSSRVTNPPTVGVMSLVPSSRSSGQLHRLLDLVFGWSLLIGNLRTGQSLCQVQLSSMNSRNLLVHCDWLD
uniref:Secreted protein n=1 Tax=Panagrellus redivivus TaxID=6233 RepID=A0A7E4ZQ32_PANRE